MPFHGRFDAFDKYGNGYMFDEYPHRRVTHPFSAYVTIPPLLDMPVTIEEAKARDALPRFASLLLETRPSAEVVWCAMEFHIAKEWVYDHETVTDVGHACWVDFVSIPPSWFLLDYDEAYILLTEEQYGRERPLVARR